MSFKDYLREVKNKITGYDVMDSTYCKTCSSFSPFSGNNTKICRNYELGRCPEEAKKWYREKMERIKQSSEEYLKRDKPND